MLYKSFLSVSRYLSIRFKFHVFRILYKINTFVSKILNSVLLNFANGSSLSFSFCHRQFKNQYQQSRSFSKGLILYAL